MSEETEIREAQDGWLLLRSGGKTSTAIGTPTRVSEATGPYGPVRFALGGNGEARLLLPLGPGENPRVIRGAPALAVEVSTFNVGGQPQRFLELTCMDTRLEEVFGHVADQILERIRGNARSVEAALSTIEEFRHLLLRSAAADVTTEQIAGLVGELLVLKRLLDRSPSSWTAWRGPEKVRHDFSRGSTALEVKVTLGRGRTRIAINGLEQLAEPEGGRLYLQHFEMEAVAGGLLSVSSLGRAVLAAASEPDRVQALLADVGCVDVHDEAWNTTGFRLENETLYEVQPGFPRLIASDLPENVAAGISDVQYTIDLAGAVDFRVDRPRVGEIEELLVP